MPPPSPSDEELARDTARGSLEAFEELFFRKHRRVYLIACQILGDTAAAEDVVQETFLAFWRHRRRHRIGKGIDGWIRRIATNKAIDSWRRVQRRRERAAVAELPDSLSRHAATATLESSQLQAIWDDVSQALTPQQRAAFVLREIEGLESRAVGEAMGCDASTVRSHVSNARRILRLALRQRYPELVSDSQLRA